VCGADDDVGDGRGDADFDAGVALLGQLTLEEFVQFGVENTIGDELSPLGAAENKMVSLESSSKYASTSAGEQPATLDPRCRQRSRRPIHHH
jgi:hypothetical protein